jgi:hypothetical protein
MANRAWKKLKYGNNFQASYYSPLMITTQVD